MVAIMTNREWLNNLSDEDFAKWINNEYGGSKQDLLDLIKWLKETKVMFLDDIFDWESLV